MRFWQRQNRTPLRLGLARGISSGIPLLNRNQRTVSTDSGRSAIYIIYVRIFTHLKVPASSEIAQSKTEGRRPEQYPTAEKHGWEEYPRATKILANTAESERTHST